MNPKEDLSAQESLARRLEGLSPEKRLLLEKRLGNESARHTPSSAYDPIAIIGMSCRFPGAADSPEAFWKLLCDGRDAVAELPQERWDASLLDRGGLESDEKALLRWGGFVDGIDRFDPAFFDISPREAATMDPQQRLAMEVAWEALESAGQPLMSLTGSDTGIFMGLHSQSSDYYWLQLNAPGQLDTHAATGGAHSIAANRLSYFLDLRGPSMAVDTACSSSLVAIHLACQSLRSRECDLALAGGVNLILSPDNSYAFSKLQFLSPDGRCKTFDAGANGYVRGEGCGVVVLRRLKDAVDAGDPVLAIIRGSAVNQDGATNGLTAPSGLSQRAIVRRALTNAGVAPEKVTFVETHGTGTPLGDPIEVESLVEVMGADHSDALPCHLGAVKSNIGHLEAAAGIAGIIKTVLCLQHRRIPPNLHFTTLNPHITLQGTRMRIPIETLDWTAADGERFAGVSSFGFGGTNAHVVLQEAPRLPVEVRSAADGPAAAEAFLLPLSARSDESLAALVKFWREFLAGPGSHAESLEDICFTAAVRRTHHGRRFAVVARGREELIERLAAFEKAPDPSRQGTTMQGEASGAGGLVFVFSGQGPQWIGMGRRLLDQEPVYRETVERCDSLLRDLAGWSLLDELRADEAASRLNRTEFAQPALFALQMGLASLWGSWGIEPDAVVGHSVGEVAAACFSGVLSLAEAVRVVYHRGRLLQRIAGQGRMAAVHLSADRAAGIIAGYQDRLTIAAINSRASVTLSGEAGPLEEVLEMLGRQNIFCRRLKVDYAFHSSQTEPCSREMQRAVEDLSPQPPRIPILSTVTGRAAEEDDYGPAYWTENIRRPVQFAAAVDALIEKGHRTFVEIGPHPVLSVSINQCLEHRGIPGRALASLQREREERPALLESLGALYTEGRSVEWRGLYRKLGRCVALPAYPWRNRRYWIESVRPPENDRFYEIAWLPKLRAEAVFRSMPEASVTAEAPARHWLVFADQSGVGAALAERMRSAGQVCLSVSPNGTYQPPEKATACLDPRRSADFERLLKDAAVPGAPPLAGAVYLWGLDAVQADDALPSTMEESALTACTSLLHLVQALTKAGPEARLRTWVVTRGAQAVEGFARSISLAQTPLWGLGRAIDLERPEIWGGMIDLDPGDDPSLSADRLIEEITRPDGEDQIALRGERRLAARLERTRSRDIKADAPKLDAQGTYLITGGLGRLGLKVARWMAEQGAGHIVLLGRRSLPEYTQAGTPSSEDIASQKAEAIRAIERAGAVVEVVRADVADPDQMSSLFDRLGRSGRKLKGVVHAAAAIVWSALQDLGGEDFKTAFASKIAGAWILHRLTAGMDLDFFVLFSSGASVWGSKDLAPYAAANQFLDGLAYFRRGRGLSALSINWGWWAGGGAPLEAERYFAQIGLRPMADPQGLAALGALLTTGATQKVVSDFDWDIFGPVLEIRKRRPLIDRLRPLPKMATQEKAPPDLPRLWTEASPSDRFNLLIDRVRTSVAQVLRLETPAQLDPKQGFFSMGMDSLMALQLKVRLENGLGKTLPTTIAFECPSIDALAKYLAAELSGEGASAGAPAPEGVPAVPEEELSEDELTELLAEKLKRLQ
jgi:myxalamid-type polyketide synthase MxaC